MQFWDCKITLSFSNQKIKDRSETLINKGIYEVELKFIASLIKEHLFSNKSALLLVKECVNGKSCNRGNLTHYSNYSNSN